MGAVDLSKFSDDEIMKGAGSLIPSTEKKKHTSWSHEPLLTDLKADFDAVKGSRSAFISRLTRWEELYNAPKFGDEKSKTSRINPKLVRKQVEWRAPALSEPFLSTTNLFDVKPISHEDIGRAKQNALILNRQFNTQLNKVSLVDKVIRSVSKDGTVFGRVGWKSKDITVKEMVTEFTYREAMPEEQEQLAGMYEEYGAMRTEAPDSYEQLPEEIKAGLEMSLESQSLLVAEPSGEIEVETTKTIINKPTVEICDIRNVYVDPTCKGNLDNAQFVIYSYETSLSDLKKDGNFKNLDKLEQYEESGSLDHNNLSDLSGFKFLDKARKKIVVYEYWGYWDIDGSGETQAITASWVGNTVIRMEENPFPDGKPPFVCWNYIPEEDSIYGIPDAELLGDNQEIIGAVTRGVIDLMGKSANAQTGYSKNFLDFSNEMKFKRGEDYVFNPGFDPRVHMHTHTFPEVPNSAMQVIQMFNNDAEAMSGIKAFGQEGLNAVNFGNTATGVRGVLDAVSKREMSVLRRISDGFIKLGYKIISMNSEFLSEEEVVRITNEEFVTVRRDDLAGEFDLSLTISTAEADNAKAEELAFMLQTMGDSMGQEVMKMVLSQIATLRKMPDLAKMIEEYSPEPDPIQQELAQLEVAKQQAEIEKIQAEAAEAHARAMVYQAKVAVEEARAESLKGDANNKALDFEQKDTGVKQRNELEKQDAINAGSLQAQEAKALAEGENMKTKHNLSLKQALAAKEMELNGIAPDSEPMGGIPDEGLPEMVIPMQM